MKKLQDDWYEAWLGLVVLVVSILALIGLLVLVVYLAG